MVLLDTVQYRTVRYGAASSRTACGMVPHEELFVIRGGCAHRMRFASVATLAKRLRCAAGPPPERRRRRRRPGEKQKEPIGSFCFFCRRDPVAAPPRTPPRRLGAPWRALACPRARQGAPWRAQGRPRARPWARRGAPSGAKQGPRRPKGSEKAGWVTPIRLFRGPSAGALPAWPALAAGRVH